MQQALKTQTRWAELRGHEQPGLCSSPPPTEDLAEQAALRDAGVSTRGPSCWGTEPSRCGSTSLSPLPRTQWVVAGWRLG